MLPCPKCEREFDRKWRLRAHLRKDHRAPPPGTLQAVRRPAVNLGHAVPTNARALRVVGFFPITRAPPRGFAATDLPLFRVKYLLPDCSASVTAISSYSRIHARYPGEICDYFMSVTVFKKPGKPIKTTIDIGQNKVNGAFSDETNFCFIVDQDAESVAPHQEGTESEPAPEEEREMMRAGR